MRHALLDRIRMPLTEAPRQQCVRPVKECRPVRVVDAQADLLHRRRAALTGDGSNRQRSAATASTATGEWPTYGGDLANSKYSPLDQITAANFASLKIAWRMKSPDGFLSLTLPDGTEWSADSKAIFDELNRLDPKRWRDGQPPFVQNYKVTPLMVGGTLYVNTPSSVGAAYDAQDRRAEVGLQPQELRSRHHDHEPAMESARRGVLA